MSTLTATPAAMHRQVRHRAVAVTATVVTALLLWSLAVLEPHAPPARPVWTGATATVLLVSLAGPLTAATTSPAAAWLILLHLSLAAVLIPLLRRTTVAR